jgi:hypothetical protein
MMSIPIGDALPDGIIDATGASQLNRRPYEPPRVFASRRSPT